MEKYRNLLKFRMGIFCFIVLSAIVLGIFDVFFASDTMKANVIFSFQSGLTAAGGILALLRIIQYSKVLHDEKLLKLQYNQENDERMKTIRAKAGMPMLLISSAIIIIVAIIVGYFNTIVFYTLIIVAVSQMVLGCAVKFVYMKKM